MTTEQDRDSRYSISAYSKWPVIFTLLEAEQYERVAEILHEVELKKEQFDETTRIQLLAAVRQISLACHQCQAESIRHQRSYNEVKQREAILRRELFDILKTISESTAVDPSLLTRCAQTAIPDEASPRFLRKGQEFLQYLKNLLRWHRLLPSLVSGTLLKSFDRPILSSLEKGEQSTATSLWYDRLGSAPTLIIHCLGSFQVFQDDQPVVDWPKSKGKSIFKYLIVHRERPTPKEVLMELFWPEAHPDAARNNLNVAIHSLRQTLRQTCADVPYIVFQDDCYLLNPALNIWVDVERFLEHLKIGHSYEARGQLASAAHAYAAAEALYQGDFLEENRYEDWLIPIRQRLQNDYLDLLDYLTRYYLDQEKFETCATLCLKMLAIDPGREQAHRRLMRTYSRQGQRYLALRQYHMCVETLAEELDISPSTATENLYEKVRQDQPI